MKFTSSSAQSFVGEVLRHRNKLSFPFTNKTCIHTIQPTQIANYHLVKPKYTSLMKQQFLIAHTSRQNEILALLSRQLGYKYIFSQKDVYMKKFLVLTL